MLAISKNIYCHITTEAAILNSLMLVSGRLKRWLEQQDVKFCPLKGERDVGIKQNLGYW
jgi:hypothetical protein